MTIFFTFHRVALAIAGVCALTVLAPNLAAAQGSPLCTKRHSMVKALENKYQEQRRGLGITSSVGVMEIFVSPKGTWTVIMSRPNGVSCIVAAGRDWQDLDLKPTGTSI